MAALDLTVISSVLAILRRDLTPSCVADRFGVTEAEVLEWQDIFLAAGVLALAEFRCGGKVWAHLGPGTGLGSGGGDGDPGDPTTTPDPTTTNSPTSPEPMPAVAKSSLHKTSSR
jgi:hypothetical protein